MGEIVANGVESCTDLWSHAYPFGSLPSDLQATPFSSTSPSLQAQLQSGSLGLHAWTLSLFMYLTPLYSHLVLSLIPEAPLFYLYNSFSEFGMHENLRRDPWVY